MNSNTIFRKSSLDRISSPEQLNDYIKVTRPSLWMVLGAVTALLVGVVIWGVFGFISTTGKAIAVVQDGKAVCYADPGKIPIPDEALELVSGGGLICKALDEKFKPYIICPLCGAKVHESDSRDWFYSCKVCSTVYIDASEYMKAKWYVRKYCPQCHIMSEFEVSDLRSFKYRCNYCGYHN